MTRITITVDIKQDPGELTVALGGLQTSLDLAGRVAADTRKMLTAAGPMTVTVEAYKMAVHSRAIKAVEPTPV